MYVQTCIKLVALILYIITSLNAGPKRCTSPGRTRLKQASSGIIIEQATARPRSCLRGATPGRSRSTTPKVRFRRKSQVFVLPIKNESWDFETKDESPLTWDSTDREDTLLRERFDLALHNAEINSGTPRTKTICDLLYDYASYLFGK